LGKDNNVVVKRLAEDTIEERMFQLQDVKMDTLWPELVCNSGVTVMCSPRLADSAAFGDG